MLPPPPNAPKPPRGSAAPVDAESRALLFESVMANAKDAVLVTEAEPVDLASGGPRIIYVNEAFTAMTGFSSEEAVGQTPRMLQSPRTDQRELDRLRRALRRWEPVDVELLNVHKDGTEFWVQFIIVPVADADGWYTHWVSIQRDVTARRKRSDALDALMRGTLDIVALVTADGRIASASPAAEATLAPVGEALVGSRVVDLLQPEQQALGRAMLRSVGRPDARDLSRELQLRTPDGWRWFEATARLASFGEDGESFVVTATDVTERRRTRAELQQAQRRFRGAFAEAPIGMAVLARDGTLLEVNAQLCRLVGLDETRLLALGLEDLVHPEDREGNEAERREIFAGTMEVSRRETRLHHADGRVVGVMLSSSVVCRGNAVDELVVHVEDISERKALEARLTHQALHDDLTHLPNRALFLDRLHTALERGERDRVPVSVLFLDVDRFKAVNDSFGHQTGDLVLTTVARRLDALVRPGDTAARFAGDEFAILCDGADEKNAVGVAERIVAAIEAPIALPNDGELRVRASVGIATAESAEITAEMLLRDADMAMYSAKGAGGTRYRIFEEGLRSRSVARIDREQELRRAIADDELELRYQPLFGVGTGAPPTEFEALVRWRHPTRGLLSPAEFIPLAEKTGLIVDIDRWVLLHACRDVSGLPIEDAKVWVNLSLLSLAEPDLAEHVQASLEASGLGPASLGLEITERAVVEGGDDMGAVVGRLRALGVELAADDFGTGYSSLSALIERPVDVLKIDRSFVSGLPGPTSVAVVRAIVAMAAALELRTVAEGVEEPSQLEAIRELGCDRVQGYLLARPMTLATIAEDYAATPSTA